MVVAWNLSQIDLKKAPNFADDLAGLSELIDGVLTFATGEYEENDNMDNWDDGDDDDFDDCGFAEDMGF